MCDLSRSIASMTGYPLEEKIRENREFCEKKFHAGKNQGIWKKWVKLGKNQRILQEHVRQISGNFQPVS